jgi:hypothetical protein
VRLTTAIVIVVAAVGLETALSVGGAPESLQAAFPFAPRPDNATPRGLGPTVLRISAFGLGLAVVLKGLRHRAPDLSRIRTLQLLVLTGAASGVFSVLLRAAWAWIEAPTDRQATDALAAHLATLPAAATQGFAVTLVGLGVSAALTRGLRRGPGERRAGDMSPSPEPQARATALAPAILATCWLLIFGSEGYVAWVDSLQPASVEGDVSPQGPTAKQSLLALLQWSYRWDAWPNGQSDAVQKALTYSAALMVLVYGTRRSKEKPLRSRQVAFTDLWVAVSAAVGVALFLESVRVGTVVQRNIAIVQGRDLDPELDGLRRVLIDAAIAAGQMLPYAAVLPGLLIALVSSLALAGLRAALERGRRR